MSDPSGSNAKMPELVDVFCEVCFENLVPVKFEDYTDTDVVVVCSDCDRAFGEKE